MPAPKRPIMCVRVSEDLRDALLTAQTELGADTLSDTVRWLLEDAVGVPRSPATPVGTNDRYRASAQAKKPWEGCA